MSARKDNSEDDRSSSDRYSNDFDSEDEKKTQTPKSGMTPKKSSHHHYYQDKFRGKGLESTRRPNPGNGVRKVRGNNRTSDPPVIRKSHNTLATRVLSASRHRINELRNKVEELNIQIRDLHQENKLYKRMQFRQEKVIRVFEDKENDLPSILDRHNNEVRAMREQNKRLKDKFDKTDRYLRDAEDELERVKKKMNKYKKICDQQELQERDELNRKLAQAQLGLEEKEAKLKELHRYVEMLKNNHRHELGIEVARQREMKKQVDDLVEKNSQLENQLKEKEKALEYLNIYSNPQQGRASRDNSPGDSPTTKFKKKTSALCELTPRDKAKLYAEKHRTELLKQRDIKEGKERKKKKQLEKEEKEKIKNTAFSASPEFVFGSKSKEKEERDRLEEESRQQVRDAEIRERQEKEIRERQEKEIRERQEKEIRERQEKELQRRQTELEVRQEQDKLDNISKENRERMEKEELERREKHKLKEKERRKLDEIRDLEERERKLLEEKKRELEKQRQWEEKMEYERKERERKEEEEKDRNVQDRKLQLDMDELDNDLRLQAETKKKEDLLKKLREMDEMGSDTFSPSSLLRKNKEPSQASRIKDVLEISNRRADSKEYSFSRPIENLHQGKPSHEDITVPYLERQRNKWQTSNDLEGYQPSFGPTRGEMNKVSTSRPPSIFDHDEPIFKLTNNSSDLSIKQIKKSTNLLENLFGAQVTTGKNTPQTSRQEKKIVPPNTSPFLNSETKPSETLTWDTTPGAAPIYKSRLDSDQKSATVGGDFIGNDLLNRTNKILPRRHRAQNLSTFSAKPSVTAIDNFDDEIEEVVL